MSIMKRKYHYNRISVIDCVYSGRVRARSWANFYLPFILFRSVYVYCKWSGVTIIGVIKRKKIKLFFLQFFLTIGFYGERHSKAYRSFISAEYTPAVPASIL